MAITPGPGYKVDPNNPNAVVPIGAPAAQNNPNYAMNTPTVSNTSITRTSPTPAPTPTPQPTYTPVPGTANTMAPAPAPTSSAPLQGNALVMDNQAKAAALGVSIPGVGGGSPASTTPQAPTTYPGLVNSLANNSLVGSPIAGQAAQGLISSAQPQNNPLTSGAAYDVYSKAVQNLSTFKQQIANTNAGLETSEDVLPTVLGREGALQKQNSGKLQALQEAVNQAQAALGYGIQEQGQQQSGLTSAGNIGNTAQGLLQSGINSAAGYAQPQTYAPTSIPFNPLTGTFGNYAGASGSGGLAGIGAALQQQEQGADVQKMISAYNQTNGLISNFNKNSAGFNESPLALGNALTQWLKTGVVPDPKYANAINTLQEIANTIAPVLGTPGYPSDMKTVIANELVPRLMNGQDISTVLQQLEVNASTKINAAQKTATGAPLDTPTPPAPLTSGNSYTSPAGNTYKLPN